MVSQLFLKPDFVFVLLCFVYLHIDNKLISCVVIKNTVVILWLNIIAMKSS